VRAWGDCNSEFSRYFESVVGDRPEFCVLDFHGFEDLDYAVIRNIVSTSWLPVGHKDRFDNGNTAELASAVVRTWETHPTSERIVEDMTRLSAVILDKIIEAGGGLVPDFEMQHDGCSKRKRNLRDVSAGGCRVYVPTPEVVAAEEKRCEQLRMQANAKVGKVMCGNLATREAWGGS
jgi:hypothetical protein